MQIGDLNILFGQHPQLKVLGEELRAKGTHVLVSGLHASARALALSQVARPLFIVLDNAEAAEYMYSDLKSLETRDESRETRVLFFPQSQKRRAVDEAAVIQRTECLTALGSRVQEFKSSKVQEFKSSRVQELIVVTYPEAMSEAVPGKEELSGRSMTLKVGQEIQQTSLAAQLADLGFERVDFVFQPGQYAVRGSIVDIYSYSHDIPYRFDFFGDEIDSIREFDIEDQLSKSRIEEATITCTKGQCTMYDSSIVDYLSEETVWVSNDFHMVQFKLSGLGDERISGLVDERTTI